MPNLKNDANFKAIFTQKTPESKAALVSFLEAAIGRKISEAEVSVTENEPAVEREGQRGMSFDILCEFTDGSAAEIEMEGFEHEYDFGKRAQYATARFLATHFSRGDEWEKVPTVYQISVLNFHYTPRGSSALHHFAMRDAKDGRELPHIMNIIFMELPKLPVPSVQEIKNLREIEKWGIFIRDCDKEDSAEYIKEILKTNRGIEMAETTAYRMSEETQRKFWDISRDKAERDYNTLKGEAERRGRREAILSTARNLLALGVITHEQISQATGLPLEKVQELAAEIVVQ